ncbi:Rha family transcriptional regulator [Ralstonia solanacearum P673]|uniref:Rha family transcriptional regulator n=1 Tax=Ralstonia solanacearum TaxID=305 RepID=UPI00044A69D8|nr:Rha family transcriptional regulator [Ralstonia solanacearum]EUJ15027.1 hypothetical protein RSP673_07685 [Ralstonia solanacearum P673]MCL9849231.1 Rha family transcriptional regulator [Ralstonia solanacearum]MCL9854819.1 Rha family transcriptional regulator [Ralstonia solanacearum]MCL9860039.1 Rha family transcriptional regulator [Ralstonia solanacearum]MCL9864497.1 Rha family transcriptional regulator [Ralstonia solanacearum]
MGSREIADLMESRHEDARRSIERLADRVVITLPPMAEVSNTGPGPRLVKEYRVCRRDSYIVVAQLSPELTARLVDRWQLAKEGGLKLASVCSVVNALVKNGKLQVVGTKTNPETGMQNELVRLA